MRFDPLLTDDALLHLMGERLAARRLAKNLTQEQLAQEAGLGLRTVQRLENGDVATRLSGFLRVCRVLGLVERLDVLLPEERPSPLALLESHGRRRQRASGARKPPPSKAKPWTWGEPE